MQISFLILSGITFTGNVVFWEVIALNMYWKEDRKKWFIFILALTTDFILNKILKYVFMRPRPGTAPFGEFGAPYGFPSSHAQTVSFSTSYLALQGEEKNWKRFILSCVLTGLVAYSRVALRYHYWSDVIAGVIIGGVTGASFLKIKNSLTARFSLTSEALFFALLLSLLIGGLLYAFFPLYPALVTGVTVSIIPWYGLYYKWTPQPVTPPSHNRSKVFLKHLLGTLSLVILFIPVYYFFRLDRDLIVISWCVFGGYWIFFLYPHL